MPNKGYCDCTTNDPKWCGYCLAKIAEAHDNEPRVPKIQEDHCTCNLTSMDTLCDYCVETLGRMNGSAASTSLLVDYKPHESFGLVNPDANSDAEDFVRLSDFEESLPGIGKEDLTGWSSKYYELPEGAKEIADLIEHRNMNFNVGNIFKAAYRLGTKRGTTEVYDLEKILWFAERELARVKK
jgi:hypothetical protein